ncbi:HAD family hydrolase, partial [Rhizobium leguminosarum]|uniref:HAD family hydrolase n=1 Tax=Rhizobium leguminosarum TaxID=384 RepID=UPI003F9CA60E
AITRAKAAGLRLAILSNKLDLFYDVAFRKRFPLIDLFDVIVAATYTKILNPDPRAYEQVIAKVGLPREACVLVDDQLKN